MIPAWVLGKNNNKILPKNSKPQSQVLQEFGAYIYITFQVQKLANQEVNVIFGPDGEDSGANLKEDTHKNVGLSDQRQKKEILNIRKKPLKKLKK